MKRSSSKILSLIMCMAIVGGCSQQDFNNTVTVVVNDVTDAIGGAEVVVLTAGAPTNPVQAACIAAWGVISGAAASARTTANWPGVFNDTVNLRKLHAPYWDGDNPYESFGVAHNEIINDYFKFNPEINGRQPALINDDAGANFMTDYMLQPNSNLKADCGVTVNYVITVLHREIMNNSSKKLITEGLKHRYSNFAQPADFDNYLNDLNLSNEIKNAAVILRSIISRNYYNTIYNPHALAAACHEEVLRVKNNYYNLNATEKVYALTWIAILKYSAAYWHHFHQSQPH